MLAAQNIPGEDSLLATLLGFGALALFIAVVATPHVLRWRRRGFAPRLRTLRHRAGARRPQTPVCGSQPPASLEAGTGNATASRAPAGRTPHPPLALNALPPASAAPADGRIDRSASATTSLRAATPGARQPAQTLQPLAQQVDHTRRLAVAEDRVATVLGALAR